MDKETLERLIFEEKKSYEEIGRMFNCCGNNVKKRAKKLGIILPVRCVFNNFATFNKNKLSKVYKIEESLFRKGIEENHSFIDIFKFFNFENPYNHLIRKDIRSRCKTLGIKLVFYSEKSINIRTKGDIFSSYTKNQTSKNIVRQYSRQVYKENNGERKCFICGYDKFVEIAHIKPVPEFSDESLISEINHFDNLIALCPNHHLELDNGLIKISKVNGVIEILQN